MWPSGAIPRPKLSARARQDAKLKIEVWRVFDENFRVYGRAQGLAAAQSAKASMLPLARYRG